FHTVPSSKPVGGSHMLANFVWKGLTVQVEPNVLQTLQNSIRKDEMSMEEMEAAIVALKAEVETLKGAKAVSDETAKAATLELEKAKDSMSEEKLDALVNARVELVSKAQGILGKEVKLDGKKRLDIMKECIASKMPAIKLDGKSDVFVEGCFAALEFKADTEKNPDNSAQKFNVDTKQNPPSDLTAKIAEQQAKRLTMWNQKKA
ncbi:MAG: hypothetical protein ACRCYP_03155, partial [Alphaproteobacteria bacterium]